jgi:PPOX class probable F420-dependent enzyme
MDAMNQFENQKYLNLETFRKNGESMKTPVWFVIQGKFLFISTLANSGKVKRIRNNRRVNIVSCKMDGNINGAWVPAEARLINEPEIILKVNSLFNKKYGLIKKLFDNQRSKNGRKDAILEIKIIE